MTRKPRVYEIKVDVSEISCPEEVYKKMKNAILARRDFVDRCEGEIKWGPYDGVKLEGTAIFDIGYSGKRFDTNGLRELLERTFIEERTKIVDVRVERVKRKGNKGLGAYI